MEQIITGTPKQIAYAADLRETTVALLRRNSAGSDTFHARVDRFKADRLEACTDAGKVIDWCKGHFAADGTEIITPREEEEIRLATLADAKREREAEPEPEPAGLDSDEACERRRQMFARRRRRRRPGAAATQTVKEA
ncbi:hypothetical protein [Bifidobacterium platyrrhinorum]|uniref:Uncharacterized protein n=1 Tax=Bifidobacterium platyrrhinorum TaxID=2661628 RepID=A0A6L9SU12_9BIFI|nr:hypothetical protein [Bifidobacterium platyrrhinorum]NEG56106.1 hypothetical protein [Bifidobacterium platyrrhinorum]